MTKAINADLCIIGAGSAGLSVAAGAAQLGRKVVLIEKGEMGGDCLNTGCVPSKALIAAAARAHAMRGAGKFGIKPIEPEIDFSAVMDHVDGVIASIAPIDSQERFEGLGVTVLREHASFAGPRQVKTETATVSAKHFVIATGSAPFIPPINGLGETAFFTNETIFKNRTLPEHLIVIGGGPIGVEMAQAHRRLGAKVTLIEGETILNKDDPELVEVVRAQLKQDGVDVIEQAMVETVSASGGGVELKAGGRTISGSHLLVAVGRKPTVDGLNLEAAGVDYDRTGIKTDSALRTSNKRIYAIGDVRGGLQFTHVAGYHASVVIRGMLFKMPATNNDNQAPWVTYSDPELAQVGLTEAAARERHGDIRTVRATFADNDRAEAMRDTRGLIKVTTAKDGTILGAAIVGPGAGDLIQNWAFAISNRQKIKAFTNMIAPYPTRGEISKRAAGAWYTPALFSSRTKMLVSLLSVFD
jgi:pyruvate/2-oxoglutarate dehydrogenase complex dihydrolipoamide dehydrogenase (E3) component